MKRTLVLGLGNPILSDDSVGLRVVQELQKILLPRKDLVIDEDHWGGLRLMERLAGFDRAIIIDAIQSGAAPGTIRCLHPNEIPTQHSASAHDVNLPTALAFGRQMGLHLPLDDAIVLIAIEAEDVLTFGEECTPAVAAAIPQAVKLVQEILENWDRQAMGEPS
ncbi:hydrogenase maturation protease [Thermogutta sp.]|uniref:hydrogenase maturation protease n=1 Tax=Thermogutta sp. TaxID=1962930 RepID=UPI00322071AC